MFYLFFFFLLQKEKKKKKRGRVDFIFPLLLLLLVFLSLSAIANQINLNSSLFSCSCYYSTLINIALFLLLLNTLHFCTFHCILGCALTGSHNQNNNNKTNTFTTSPPTTPPTPLSPITPPLTFEVKCLTRFTQSTPALAAILLFFFLYSFLVVV